MRALQRLQLIRSDFWDLSRVPVVLCLTGWASLPPSVVAPVAEGTITTDCTFLFFELRWVTTASSPVTAASHTNSDVSKSSPKSIRVFVAILFCFSVM